MRSTRLTKFRLKTKVITGTTNFWVISTEYFWDFSDFYCCLFSKNKISKLPIADRANAVRTFSCISISWQSVVHRLRLKYTRIFRIPIYISNTAALSPCMRLVRKYIHLACDLRVSLVYPPTNTSSCFTFGETEATELIIYTFVLQCLFTRLLYDIIIPDYDHSELKYFPLYSSKFAAITSAEPYQIKRFNRFDSFQLELPRSSNTIDWSQGTYWIGQ